MTPEDKKIQELSTELGRIKKEKADLEALLAVQQGVEVNGDTLTKIVNGALKTAIQTHGPITLSLIGSASKRITGDLKGYIRSLAKSRKE